VERTDATTVLGERATRGRRKPGALSEDEPFRLLTEGSFEGLSISESVIFLYVNRSFAELLGYEPDELIGRSALDFIAPDQREVVGRNIESRYAEPYETAVVRKDGCTVDVEIQGKTLEHGGRSLRLTVVREITVRKRAEAERQRLLRQEIEARESAAFLAEASKLMVSTLDYESALDAVARLAVPFLGDWCAVDELCADGSVRRLAVVGATPGAQLALEQMLDSLPAASGDHGIPRALGTGETVVGLHDPDAPELGACAPERQDLLREAGMRSFLAVPLTARGKTVGAITFVSASDPLRYGEREIRLAEDLAQRAALAVDNARLYREAREAIRLREEFLSVASHELYTPITSLLLLLQHIRRRNGSGPPLEPSLTKRLLGAERQGERLALLVRRLLDVSRIQRHGLALEREPVELVALVNDVAERLGPDLETARCPFSVRADSRPVGRWDRLRLEQVVTNLLTNAIKYGAGKAIEVTVERAGDRVRLTVADHGIGIASTDQKKLFQPFERAVSAKNYGGLGLGLYICRTIAEAHGGSIEVRSVHGEGTTIVVELPGEDAP
jgi:PAS domain S-box-containing protein